MVLYALCTHAAGEGWAGGGQVLARQDRMVLEPPKGLGMTGPKTRQDKRQVNGDCVMARVVATLGSSSGSNLLTLDLCQGRADVGLQRRVNKRSGDDEVGGMVMRRGKDWT